MALDPVGPAPGRPPSGAPPPVPPRALRSLADGFILAHRHFLQLYPLALLVDWSLELAITLTTGGGPNALFRAIADAANRGRRDTARAIVLLGAGAALSAFLPTLVTTAFVARATRSLARGRPARALESLGSGLRRLHVAVATAAAFAVVPTAAAWFLSERHRAMNVSPIPIVFLLALLLTAAIIARFVLATPAAVLERRGLIGAWRRSERLVEGSMWRVIGMVLAVGLLGAILVRVVVGGGAFALAEAFAPGFDDHAPSAVAAAISFASSAVEAWFHLIVGVMTTLLFERMRRMKEGPDADELQQIFA